MENSPATQMAGVLFGRRSYAKRRPKRGIVMAAIAKVLSRIKVRDADVEALQVVAIFSGLGLLLSLMFLTYGIDLSPGFF
jgi:hypothetical protein